MAKRVSSASISHQAVLSGWGWLFIQLFLLPSLLNWANGMLPRALSKAELNFVFYLLNFLAVILIFGDFLADSLRHAIRHPAYLCQAVILGLAAYYATTWAVTQLVQLAEPGFANVNDSAIADLSKGSWFLMAIGTVVLAPPVEECFYRGLVFRQLYPKSRWAAYVLSMLVFAAIHVVGYIGKFSVLRLGLCLVQYFPAGLCLAWAYAKADTIIAPMMIHALINARSVYLLL